MPVSDKVTTQKKNNLPVHPILTFK
jgi:hypothetical protein